MLGAAYHPDWGWEGIAEEMSARTGRVSARRLLAPPCALAGSPWDVPAAITALLLMAAVFVVEILTPDVVVGALLLLPLLAAMWLLSGRLAALIAVIAALLFAGSVALESSDRPTLLVMGAAMLVLGVLVRVYAAGISSMLGSGHLFTTLTQREKEVARLAGQAYTAAEIGARLHIGERTVETHLANTYTKLRIKSRRELIRIASRLGP
jgi:DNA-binding CsgD family transcriptional regulator